MRRKWTVRKVTLLRMLLTLRSWMGTGFIVLSGKIIWSNLILGNHFRIFLLWLISYLAFRSRMRLSSRIKRKSGLNSFWPRKLAILLISVRYRRSRKRLTRSEESMFGLETSWPWEKRQSRDRRVLRVLRRSPKGRSAAALRSYLSPEKLWWKKSNKRHKRMC